MGLSILPRLKERDVGIFRFPKEPLWEMVDHHVADG